MTAQRELLGEDARRRQAQKMQALGALVGGIAHDFNNTLTSIVGFGELALDSLPEDAPERAALKDVLLAASRATLIVSRLLTFSRAGAAATRVPVDVAREVNECLDIMRAAMPSTVKLDRHIETGCGLALAAPGQVQQIVMNLCTNACQAMASTGGVLQVTAEPVQIDERTSHSSGELDPGRYVRLRMTDSGPGIDPYVKDRTFDPFFTTRATTGGVGIGLAVVDEIVKSLGGTIDAQSAVGRGATFMVHIPRTDEPAAPRANERKDPQRAKRKEHVLVVDDEEPIVKLTRWQLEKLGYRVTTRSSGLQALQTLSRARDIDLVLADLTMPGVTGRDIALKLKDTKRKPPVLLMSGFQDTAAERARDAGAVGLLSKPFCLVELGQAVRDALSDGCCSGEGRRRKRNQGGL